VTGLLINVRRGRERVWEGYKSGTIEKCHCINTVHSKPSLKKKTTGLDTSKQREQDI
jgi:hypothetical protein